MLATAVHYIYRTADEKVVMWIFITEGLIPKDHKISLQIIGLVLLGFPITPKV